MIDNDLKTLGSRVAELRISRRLKQSELAYEAGVSARTLQRLEAGEVVKSDGLIKVIKYLGRLDRTMAALEVSEFSPYEKLAETGLKPSQLNRQHDALARTEEGHPEGPSKKSSGQRAWKRRVRHSRGAGPGANKSAASTRSVKVQWPEDQQ